MNTLNTISVDATPLSSDQASLRRMQWRCRRGMLELDLVFTPFVQRHLPALSKAQISALDDLLEMPDNALWNLLTEPRPGNDVAKQQVLDMLMPGRVAPGKVDQQ